jgi:hypothetical protein
VLEFVKDKKSFPSAEPGARWRCCDMAIAGVHMQLFLTVGICIFAAALRARHHGTVRLHGQSRRFNAKISYETSFAPAISQRCAFLHRQINRLVRPFRPRMPLPAKFLLAPCNWLGGAALCARFSPPQQGRHFVDLALRLNVLAVCAVFVFVGAVLLGAF